MSERPATYETHLSQLLAGRTRAVREPALWHERILDGLPISGVETVKARAALTDAEMARLLGIGEATLRRARASGEPLDPVTGDRLFRLSKVIAVALEVLETDENVRTWMHRGQPGLGGDVPLNRLLTQAGAEAVETLLWRIEYSVLT